MYSLAAIQHARDNANTGDSWNTFLADLDEYEAAHPTAAPNYDIAGQFQIASRLLVSWLSEQSNPHLTAIVTGSGAELLAGECTANARVKRRRSRPP